MTSLINDSDLGPQQPRQIRFVHNQGQPPSKRRRINAACLTCRKRKTRCAGERPRCSTCTKNGHRCLGYPEDAKKDAGEQSGVELKTEVVDDHLVPDDADNQPSIKVEKPVADAKPALSAPRAPRDGPKASVATVTKNTIEHHPVDPEPPHPNSDVAPPQPTLSLHRDTPGSPATTRRLESHRVPYFRYFGPTAIVPGFKQMVVSVRDRRRSTGVSMAGTSPLSIHSAAVASSSAADSDVIAEDLPVYDPNDAAPVHPLIINLVNIFFAQLGSNYPFLRQTRFLRMVREKRVEPILVDAICSIAARFSDAPALTGGNDKMPRTERGATFAQRARQATVDTFPCPTVGAVQACLLLAYEGFGANQDSTLWMYLGLAIRMAVDLGLQKEVGVQFQGEKDPWYRNSGRKPTELSPEEKVEDPNALTPAEQKEVVQERMDTFWAVFILDRLISSGTGRPVTFRDDDFELSFPEPSLDPVTRWPSTFPVFLQIIHLYGRVSDVLNKLRNVQDLTQDKWDKLNDMEHELTRMYKSWDSRLQFNVSNFKTYLSLGQGTTFILLHFWFHALLIILHQPTLLTPFGELRSELQLLSDSREISMSSAKTICDILSFADLIDPKSFIGNPFTNQPIYIAACAFLMESSASTSEPPSRDASPAGSKSAGPPKGPSKPRDSKVSRHSLLASAANQNYQRCYNSIQQIYSYWGGVKYIINVLDQKAKGIWDCETYSTEEYESTKASRQESSRGGMSHQFPKFESRSSPKVTGPPIAWSLAGTANSPNSSLTLMYQNVDSGGMQTVSGFSRLPSTPPGNMVYDPIRQSLPETGTMFPSPYPQPNTSAVRHSPRPPMPHRSSGLSGTSGSQEVTVDGTLDATDDADLYMPSARFTPVNAQPNGLGGFSGSPTSHAENGAAASTRVLAGLNASAAAGASNMYYPTGPYQANWGAVMESITFDSQDIDINSLGLAQDGYSGPWFDYISHDILSLFENPEVGQ